MLLVEKTIYTTSVTIVLRASVYVADIIIVSEVVIIIDEL